MNICVFCSAMELDKKYTEPAINFAAELARHGHTLVWGGSKKGLMGAIADAAKSAGGQLVGISVDRFRGVQYPNTDEMFETKNLGERKAMMLERADVLVVMVGGLGTLDEATDVIELRKHGAHSKPIIVLNTDNFYEGLRIQLQKMQDDGFLPVPFTDLVYFADTPEAAIAAIK